MKQTKTSYTHNKQSLTSTIGSQFWTPPHNFPRTKNESFLVRNQIAHKTTPQFSSLHHPNSTKTMQSWELIPTMNPWWDHTKKTEIQNLWHATKPFTPTYLNNIRQQKQRSEEPNYDQVTEFPRKAIFRQRNKGANFWCAKQNPDENCPKNARSKGIQQLNQQNQTPQLSLSLKKYWNFFIFFSSYFLSCFVRWNETIDR